MNKKKIISLAKEAGFPEGWYQGPWFDEEGNIRKGVPDCLSEFVRLVEYETFKTKLMDYLASQGVKKEIE